MRDEFLLSEVSSVENNTTAGVADTATYITDLLSELQMIANVSGLANLSDDIRAVLVKHMSQSAAA